MHIPTSHLRTSARVPHIVNAGSVLSATQPPAHEEEYIAPAELDLASQTAIQSRVSHLIFSDKRGRYGQGMWARRSRVAFWLRHDVGAGVRCNGHSRMLIRCKQALVRLIMLYTMHLHTYEPPRSLAGTTSTYVMGFLVRTIQVSAYKPVTQDMDVLNSVRTYQGLRACRSHLASRV